MMRYVFAALACLAVIPAQAAEVQEVKAGTLSAWVIEDHTLPIVTVRILFENSGASYDPSGKEGDAFFVSQTLDEGAGDMDSLAFNHALENSAVRFDATAGEDSFTVGMQSLSEYKAKGFDLLDLALSEPRFDSEAVARVRAANLASLKEFEQDPDYLASLHWKERAFAGHPYSRPRRGTAGTFGNLTPKDLHAFTALHFACSPMRISVVGDITPMDVKDWLGRLTFRKAECPAPLPPLAAVTVNDGGPDPVVVNMPLAQTVVMASLPAVTRDDPRFYAVEVLNHILGGNSLTARLGREIRDKRGLAYYAESNVATQDRTGYLQLTFATRNAKANAALDVFRDTLKKISGQGVTASELEDAKSYMTGSFPLSIDNQPALADDLIAMQHFHLGRDYIERRNANIDAVTLEQVNDAAKSLLSHTPLIVMVGAPNEGTHP